MLLHKLMQPWILSSTLSDRAFEWPSWTQLVRVFSLSDYNTRIVVLGTAVLGMAAGLVGSFTLLRRRALMGDALAHATLPGICIAFMSATWLGVDGKSLGTLLFGAALSGLLGVLAILGIRRYTRLKEDTALGIVLTVFFGAGTALMTLVQQMEAGHAAGLESFIYGKTASMVESDAKLILYCAIGCLATTVLLFKELKLLCFDDAFAGSRGYLVLLLDIVLMGLVVVVTIVGLQSVGLVLIIALMVMPAASARFWTEKMAPMSAWSAVLGAISCFVGAAVSALFPRLPSGAMIVLVAAGIFGVSMLIGMRRGVLVRALRRRNVNRRNDERHLLQGMFELCETRHSSNVQQKLLETEVDFQDLLEIRSWSRSRLAKIIKFQLREDNIRKTGPQTYTLTSKGSKESLRLVREHRLWEIYLITHADVAPSRVDRDADAIEHVLQPELIAELERALADQLDRSAEIPPDPHSDHARLNRDVIMKGKI